MKAQKEQNDMKKIDMQRADILNRKRRVLYLVFLIGLAVIYAVYIPYMMDYYIIRPEQSFFSFLYDNNLKTPYIFEGVVMGMTFAMLYCLTLHAGVSTLVMSFFLFLLTHASYIKYINRRELLRLDDLRLTEAAGMALGYFRFELNRWLVMLAGIFILFSVAGFIMEWFRRKADKESETIRDAGRENVTCRDAAGENRPHHHHKIMVCARLLGCICMCAALFIYADYFLKARYVVDEIGPLTPETDMYVLYRFLQNDSLAAISVERVEESYEFLLSQEAPKETVDREVYPNVIVIMNESWWNTDNIDTDRITFSQDPMEPYKELADRCITGYQTTNVFGGGTVSPEMEFLTGLNTKYYRGDSVYAQLQGRKLPSLADYFNGLDYETVAIHPYYGWFYSRDVVYDAMGFDKIIFEEGMQYKDIYTSYISDESLAKQIIAEEEEESGSPKFIWAVSMANHGRVLDYTAEPAVDYNYPVTISVRGTELGTEDYDALVNYVNGIYLANQAFSQLADYFSGVDRPTVLLMFGDHCPNFSTDVLEALGLGGEDRETVERLYSTPVILWSNFSRDEVGFSGESMYYLPQTLIDYAGLPDSDMARILRYERSCFKTNSLKIMRDASGNDLYQCTTEQLRALSHFRAVQYDILYGEGIGRDIWKPVIDEP